MRCYIGIHEALSRRRIITIYSEILRKTISNKNSNFLGLLVSRKLR